MPIAAGATDVFDLGYDDDEWWAKLDAAGCRIVTRLKRNTPLSIMPLSIIEQRTAPPAGNILADRIGHLPARQAKSRKNPFSKPIREVQVKIDSGKVLRILTNDLTAPADEIADLYKQRWAIELFFRWVKQTLKITRFLGTSENATQTAVTSPLVFARLIRANLMHRRDVRALLQPPPTVPTNPNQLAFL
jgi:IS4 transposase